MTQLGIKRHLEELNWIVRKGFEHRHHPQKKLNPHVIKDAITLIRMMQKFKNHN